MHVAYACLSAVSRDSGGELLCALVNVNVNVDLRIEHGMASAGHALRKQLRARRPIQSLHIQDAHPHG